MSVLSVSLLLCLFALSGSMAPGASDVETLVSQGGKLVEGPETFTANAQVKGPGGAAATTIRIQIDRYTPDFDRKSVEGALKGGGYPAFLTALRKAPSVGTVGIGDQQFAIRYARQQPAAKDGRTIVLVTEKPVFFVGGGATDAKPRAGYEVAVLRFEVDSIGLGAGSMAAAARVKPDGEGGVQLDDYASEPIKLVTVRKATK